MTSETLFSLDSKSIQTREGLKVNILHIVKPSTLSESLQNQVARAIVKITFPVLRETKGYLEAVLNDIRSDSIKLSLIFLGTEIIGFAQIIDNSNEDGVTLDKIIISDQYKRRGIARLIIIELQNIYNSISVCNSPNNPAAKPGMISLYRQLGFNEGTYPDQFVWRRN